ncbi:hypothetical protein NHF48_001900 [Sphingomonas sp. H160509]|uniref:inositol monophosphatase family protein n=1 Tax=Sphingomonas sp. H160509 TaxID=2955313 RepID=UPI0020973B13|nr:inositol monophosphatase family protein [Sphingomonas sp. H160509]MDD1449978.1 hypothetical protein [Sphingomonas sp. H160509]
MKTAVQMIRYGGECYAMAMITAGRIDLAIEPSLQPYDIVAVIPIIERAGGVVTRLDGGRAEVGGAVLVAATPALHAEALAILENGTDRAQRMAVVGIPDPQPEHPGLEGTVRRRGPDRTHFRRSDSRGNFATSDAHSDIEHCRTWTSIFAFRCLKFGLAHR